MVSVGTELRAAREQKKIPLSEVAAGTRISKSNLERLEEGRYKELPGGVYNRAFIRAYCEFIGLESREILARYEQETNPPGERASRVKEKSRTFGEPLIKPHPLAAWGVLLLVSVVGLFFSRHWIASVFSPYFAHSPATGIQPLPSAPETKSRTKPDAAQAPAQEAMPQAQTAQQPPSSDSPIAAPAQPPSEPAAKTAKSEPLPTPSRPPGKIRLDVSVLDQCWMSVNSDGNRAMVRILEAGDQQIYDADERFYLIIGNAGGIRMKINGRPAKVLGKSGEVVRILISEQTIKDLLEKSPD